MISFIFHLFGVAAFHFEMWSLKDIRLKIMQQKMEEELRPTVIVNGNYIVVQEGDYYGGTNNYDLPDGKARQTEEMREVEIPEVLLTEFADEDNTLTYFRTPSPQSELLVDDELLTGPSR